MEVLSYLVASDYGCVWVVLLGGGYDG